MRWFPIVTRLPLYLALTGCAFADSSFQSRIATINNGYDSAANTEILTNIARASDYQPLRFYLHSKFVPSQTSDLKVGLPTITIGPGQTATAKQFIFSSNGTDNSASLSLEVDPIETQAFHNSLISTIPTATIGLLLQNFPRELVFLALFSSVTFQTLGDTPIEYKNDQRQQDAQCPDYHYDGSNGDRNYDPLYNVSRSNDGYNGVPFDLIAEGPYHPPGTGLYKNLRNCNYERFRFWVANALAYGLTVEFHTGPNPQYKANDPKNTQPSTVVTGGFCFDPALAQPSLAPYVSNFTSVCDGVEPISKPSLKPPARSKTNGFPFPYSNADGRRIDAAISIQPRSLLNVYTYLGHLMIDAVTKSEYVSVYTSEARSSDDRNLFFVTRNASSSGCFAKTSFNGTTYCVPESGAANTHQLFSMITELTSLMQTVSDVPNSLSVQLTP